MRIDKFLSNFAGVSRSKAKVLLKSGRVLVNGVVVYKADYKFDPKPDSVVLDGKVVRYSKNICLMLNKPSGYVCSSDNREGIPVLSLLPDFPTVFPAGRLDKNTEGMLVLTDNGDIAHKIITPSKRVTKYYIAKLEKKYDFTYQKLFKDGIILNNERCMPAKICSLGSDDHALIELCEGKYHQVRRMLKAVGNGVEKLKRIQIGQLKMPDELPIGGHMEILHNDVEKLLKADSFESVSARVRVDFSSL